VIAGRLGLKGIGSRSPDRGGGGQNAAAREPRDAGGGLRRVLFPPPVATTTFLLLPQFKKNYANSFRGRKEETRAVVEAPRQDAGYMKLASEHMQTASSEEGIQGQVKEMCQAKEDLLFEDLGALSTSMILLAARTRGKGSNKNAEIDGQTRTDNIKHIEGILDNLSSQCYISLPFSTQEDHPGATATNNNVLPNPPTPSLPTLLFEIFPSN